MLGIYSGTLPQLYAAVFGTLFAISDGITSGWTAPMIPYLISEESHIKTTKQEAEWLETALLAGAFCGLPTIFFTEKIGRKKSLLLASFVVLIAWIAIALGDSMIYLFVARFFSGMAGNMAFVAAPMYVAEMADQKIRGFLSSIIYLMMLTGCLIVYCVGPFLPFYVPCLIGGAIAVVELSNKPEEAKKSLAYFRSNVGVEKEIKEIAEAVRRQKTEKGRPVDLLVIDSNRKALLIMTVLNAGQNFCGITIVMMNLHIILKEAGSVYMEDSYVGIIFAVIMLVAATTASFQLDKYGRKCLLMTSAIPTSFCLLAIAVYFNLKYSGYDVLSLSWIPIVAVMVYAASYKIGLGIVPIVVTAEVFPQRQRRWMYQWLANSYGLHVPFYLFAACSAALALFTLVYIPETKGKTLEEIQFILKGHKTRKQRSRKRFRSKRLI
ncbi:hypothetical protein NQ318_011358 [Aromia moschata]|uniref:Major facilitator superfamily (MFS) profile domain-containing protein n=1 Tax=Aromia moschata TaxID=1265417 RepID=A0AAV8YUL5_9CUCU|nr:hypothetical protein NQ318_011358 [Aromia moschata]